MCKLLAKKVILEMKKQIEKVLVIADLEGCIGVYDLQDNRDCCEKMEREVSLIITCLLKQKVDYITVADSHNNGNSIKQLKKKYPSVNVISHFWNVDNIELYDYAILIGFHAMEGRPGILSHTLRPEVKELYIGKILCGEVSLIINWLAYYHIKTIFISGDRGIKDEIKGYDGIFFETKSVEEGTIIENSDIEKKYNNMYISLEQAWKNRKIIKQIEYNPSEVNIVFSQYNILSLLPTIIYQITKNRIGFLNTKLFVEELYTLCQYINSAQTWLLKNRKRIGITLRKLYPEKRDFESFSSDSGLEVDILKLLKIPYNQLTIEEIYYLSRRMNELEEKTIRN